MDGIIDENVWNIIQTNQTYHVGKRFVLSTNRIKD